jgi:hypothetical protein
VTRISKLVLIPAPVYVMDNETAAGSGQSVDRSGSHGGDPGQQSPLQARAQFFQNWSWDIVIRLNRGACERGKAQHGFNPETQEAVAKEWESLRSTEISFSDLLDYLRKCHRSAPFLFFNGNTFADIGRRIGDALLAELPTSRRREGASAIAHFIAGVLDREAMVQTLQELSEAADFEPGDRVKTFRGASHGTIIRALKDGRIVWRSDESSAELIAMPESLVRLK